jgi:hypothetical protein
MVAGLQGAGKTTSIAKLACYLKERENKKVLVVSSLILDSDSLFLPCRALKLLLRRSVKLSNIFLCSIYLKPLQLLICMFCYIMPFVDYICLHLQLVKGTIGY